MIKHGIIAYSAAAALCAFSVLYPSAAKSAQKKHAAATTAANTTWESVAKQLNADCGYHALWNDVAEFVRRLHKKHMPHLPEKTLEAWRAAVIARREANGRSAAKGAWLDDGEVEFLVQYHLNAIPLPAGIMLATIHQHLTVIPNVVVFKAQNQDITDVIARLDRDNAIEAFVVGNMVQHKPNQQGHWIAIVVENKNRKFHYYALDSMGGKPQYYVDALDKILHTDINILQLAASPVFNQAFVEFTRENEPNPQMALDHLSGLIEQAKTVNALNHPLFAQTKERIISLLGDIADLPGADNVPYVDQANVLLNELLKGHVPLAQEAAEKPKKPSKTPRKVVMKTVRRKQKPVGATPAAVPPAPKPAASTFPLPPAEKLSHGTPPPVSKVNLPEDELKNAIRTGNIPVAKFWLGKPNYTTLNDADLIELATAPGGKYTQTLIDLKLVPEPPTAD